MKKRRGSRNWGGGGFKKEWSWAGDSRGWGGGEYKFQGYFKSLLTVQSIMIFETKGLENIFLKTKRGINLKSFVFSSTLGNIFHRQRFREFTKTGKKSFTKEWISKVLSSAVEMQTSKI